MKTLMTKTAAIAFHTALVALYTLPAAAAAAPLPGVGGLFHRNPTTAPRNVVVRFHNESVQPRELRIGASRIPVRGREDLAVNVLVGADVLVYSPMNSRINGQKLLTVTAASGKGDIAIK